MRQNLPIALSLLASALGAAPAKSTTDAAPHMPYYYDRGHDYFYAYGEWLYWKPTTSLPSTWAFLGNEVYESFATPGFSNPPAIGLYQMMTVDYGFDSGYRIGAGFRSKERTVSSYAIPAWQFEVNFSRMVNDYTKQANAAGASTSGSSIFLEEIDVLAPAGDLYQATNTGSSTGPALYENIKSSVCLGFSRLDGVFAWPIWCTEATILRLSAGTTFAWFKNTWDTQGDVILAIDDGPFVGTENLQWAWHYQGGGLLVGGDIQVPFGYGFGLYANTNFAMTYGNVEEDERYQFNAADIFYNHSTDISYKYRFSAFHPVWALGAGINFERWVYNKVLLGIGLGWEMNWWMGINRFSDFFNPAFRNGTPLAYSTSTTTQDQSIFINPPTDIMYQGMVLRCSLQY